MVVGEGVETEGERDVLVDLGCDLLQGYLYGKPAKTSLENAVLKCCARSRVISMCWI